MDISLLTFDDNSLEEAIKSIDFKCVDRQTCDEYALLFGRQREITVNLDEPLQFLSIVCGWRLRSDNQDTPFDCLWQIPTWQTISESQLAIVARIAPKVNDPELRARLSDLIWIRQRNHNLAQIAAADYLTSAVRLINGQKIIGEKERLIRSVQLAAQLGRNGELFSKIIHRITTIAEKPDLLHCTLAYCLDVLLNSRGGDADHLHKISVKRANKIAKIERNPLWERRFWELAAGFAGQNKDEKSQRTAILEVAHTFEYEAQHATSQVISAHFWEIALRTYRRIGGTEEDRSRVHHELLKAQKQIPKEMIPLNIEPIDIREIVHLARKRILGKNKRRALAELIFASQWHTKEYVRDQAQEAIKSYPLQHMFSSVRYSSTWKVAAISSGATPNSLDIDEDRLRAEMCQQYKYFIPIVTNGTIEPMRYEILLAHNILLEDIAEFVLYSPYIPPGREVFFTIGIHAGFHGRYIESLHVLIPQVEHMLRCLLNANNVITSRINDAGIQEEFDLNKLLYMPEAESLLGEDLSFVMQVLFSERYGYNLRNEMAHGMLIPQMFFSDAAIYTWWLIFRIIGAPIAQIIINENNSSKDDLSQEPNK